MGVKGNIHGALLRLRRRCFALFLGYCLGKQADVHFVAHGFHMTVLVCAQNAARSADFKVAHGNFKSGAELSEITYCGKALLRHIGNCLSSCEGEIGKGAAV